MVSNSRTVNNIIGALLAIIITFLCFGSTYAVEPEKPWPEDLGDGDRLYASYLNGMFGVLYNWCQNKQIILDNLLNNGNGVASVTANLLKALQEVEAPLYKINGRADAPSVNTDDGYIYYDIDTHRLMGYQEGHWRDLSPVTVVGTDSLHSPLIIEGYLETTNSYVENRVVIGNASESHNEIGTASAKIDFGNDGAIRIPVNSNPNQLNTEFGTGSIAYNPTTKKLLVYDGTNWISPVPEITVDNALSYDSENPVQNKVIANTFLQKENNSFSYIANAITTVVKNVHDQMTTITGVPALNSWPSGGTTSHETPKLQEAYNSLKALIDYIRSYVNSNDTATLNSAKAYADSKDTTTLNSAKTYADSAAATALNTAKTMPTTKPTNPTKGTMYYDTASNTLKFYDGNVWKPVSNLSQNGGIDQSGTAQNAFRGVSVFSNDINMVQGTDLIADNITADTGKFDEWLRLPTSTNSSAPTGSLAYNSTAQKLQYKDASGWKDIISSVSGSELNVRVKDRPSTLWKFQRYTSESYDATDDNDSTENRDEKIVEIGDHIVVWIIQPATIVTSANFGNHTWKSLLIEPPDELEDCSLYLPSLGRIWSSLENISVLFRYQVNGPHGTAYESIVFVPDGWLVIQPYTEVIGNTPSNILNVPYMYIVGFK